MGSRVGQGLRDLRRKGYSTVRAGDFFGDGIIDAYIRLADAAPIVVESRFRVVDSRDRRTSDPRTARRWFPAEGRRHDEARRRGMDKHVGSVGQTIAGVVALSYRG